MFKEAFVAVALALLAWSSLTCLRVPVKVDWRLALLAGEFGHVLAPVALAIGIAAVATDRGQTAWGWSALAISMVAMGFFVRPAVAAARIARTLPADLERSLGGKPEGRAPFSVTRLFGSAIPAPGPMVCSVESGGQELPMDVYLPPIHREDPPACVVLIHGGGWESGNRRQLPELTGWLLEQGYAVAAISYRLAPEHPWPAQREDTVAAISYLKASSASLGIDPRRLVLLGRSAGGQIAAAVGYTLDDPAIRGVVALYAPHDMAFVWSISRNDDALNSRRLMQQFLGGPPEGREDRYASASAQANVRQGVTPPTLLVHGVLDTLVWQRHSERLAARLAEAGVPHFNLALPWAVHACDYRLASPSGQLSTFALRCFLDRVT